MADKPFSYQQGAMLHDAIMGAFRARGSHFEEWCKDNCLTPAVVRNVTYGQMKGPKGRTILAKLIEDAGKEVVRVGYETRLRKHASEVAGDAA